MTSRPSTAAPILAVLAVVLVTLGAYVGGYLWLGERQDVIADFEILMDLESDSDAELDRLKPASRRRVFSHRWEATMFKPLASLESLFLHFPVTVESGRSNLP